MLLRFVALFCVLLSCGALVGCRAQRTYEPCVASSECPSTLSCLRITSADDRICTASCSEAAPSCPNDPLGVPGRCLSFDGGRNFSCWQACAFDGDRECPTGYRCFDTDGVSSFPPICLPLGTGG